MNAAPIFPEMQTGPRSGILLLRDATAEYFAEHSVPATVADVGLKYRSFALNQGPGGGNRVVFIPGKFDGTLSPKPRAYGTLDRKSRNHAQVGNPRELLNWDRPITISVWSAPEPGKAYDEGASVAKAEDLLEQVARAVQEFDAASIAWGEVLINAPPQENAFGVELLAMITQRGPLFDRTLEYSQPQARMQVT